MSEAATLFGALRQSQNAEAVSMLERLVLNASDRDLNKINALRLLRRRLRDDTR
jgi:hypothetical protein